MKKINIIVCFAMITIVALTTGCGTYKETTEVRKDEVVVKEDPLGTWHNCSVCKGKGRCTTCKGSGKQNGKSCSACGGTGDCSACGGEGGYRETK